jgi:hypothetical protein
MMDRPTTPVKQIKKELKECPPLIRNLKIQPVPFTGNFEQLANVNKRIDFDDKQ